MTGILNPGPLQAGVIDLFQEKMQQRLIGTEHPGLYAHGSQLGLHSLPFSHILEQPYLYLGVVIRTGGQLPQ
ncbi:MAG: hypothetical protein EPN67_07615 [Pusillimonas sp.]|nr:MAG: hypothetical protein EPN67_07615 [Pusillimonas sp.]